MKLEELKETGVRLTTSEEIELGGERNEFYEDLRKNGFYRVFETYFKDEYQCRQFYCTGFLNSENGYEWLLAINEDSEYDEEDLDKAIFDLYLVTKTSSVWNRTEKKMATGTIKEILKISQEKDKNDYKIAIRKNVRDSVLKLG